MKSERLLKCCPIVRRLGNLGNFIANDAIAIRGRESKRVKLVKTGHAFREGRVAYSVSPSI